MITFLDPYSHDRELPLVGAEESKLNLASLVRAERWSNAQAIQLSAGREFHIRSYLSDSSLSPAFVPGHAIDPINRMLRDPGGPFLHLQMFLYCCLETEHDHSDQHFFRFHLRDGGWSGKEIGGCWGIRCAKEERFIDRFGPNQLSSGVRTSFDNLTCRNDAGYVEAPERATLYA